MLEKERIKLDLSRLDHFLKFLLKQRSVGIMDIQ